MWTLVKRGKLEPVLATAETLTGIEAERHQMVEMLNEAFPGIVCADDFEVIQTNKPSLEEQKSVALTKMHDVALAMDSGDQDAVQLRRNELHSAVAEYRNLGASDEEIINLCSAYIDRYGWRR
ncbi:MAG: hypothetical protein P8Y00_00045 [Deltaproteobacteria bacterium]